MHFEFTCSEALHNKILETISTYIGELEDENFSLRAKSATFVSATNTKGLVYVQETPRQMPKRARDGKFLPRTRK